MKEDVKETRRDGAAAEAPTAGSASFFFNFTVAAAESPMPSGLTQSGFLYVITGVFSWTVG